MNSIPIISRVSLGRNGCKRLRKAGTIPGVLYGGKDNSLPISFSKEVFLPFFHKKEREFSLKWEDGKEEFALLLKIAYHPISDEILHVNFIRIQKSGNEEKKS